MYFNSGNLPKNKTTYIYSSSSSSSAAPPPPPFLAFFLLTRPGAPPPYGELVQKSMCFCESNRTRNDGTLTNCFLTLERKKKAIDEITMQITASLLQ